MRAIGRCAITLERAAERCINVLLELIHTKVNYVVQEAVVVIKDIFRRYPNRCGQCALKEHIPCHCLQDSLRTLQDSVFPVAWHGWHSPQGVCTYCCKFSLHAQAFSQAPSILAILLA